MEGMKGKERNCRGGVQRGGGANAAATLIRERRLGRLFFLHHETPALCPDAAGGGGRSRGRAGLGTPAVGGGGLGTSSGGRRPGDAGLTRRRASCGS